MSPDLDSSIQSGANEAFAELDLVDLNVILHRADGEEKDATGMYLPYLGFYFTSLHLLHPLFPYRTLSSVVFYITRFRSRYQC
jgi:hypothetical protein